MFRVCCKTRINFIRAIHTDPVLPAKTKPVMSGTKQVKVMNKLLFGKSKGKRGW